MSIFYDAPVAPDALTAFVRRVPIPSDRAFLSAFPTETRANNRIDFSEIVQTNRTAQYRSYDGRIHISARDTGSEKYVNLIPLSDALSVSEYERLQLEFTRVGGTNTQALADAIYNDAVNLTQNIQNRLELAWGDVLTDGVLTVNEGGLLGFEADFGVPAEQKGLAPATAAWSDPAATVFADIRAWTDVCVKNGYRPQTIRTTQQVIRCIQRNKDLIDMVYGATQGRTYALIQDINAVLANDGLPTFVDPYDTVLNVDGATTRVLPEGTVLLTPADLGSLGATVFGVTATALELVNSGTADMSFQEAPGVVGVVVKEGPPFRQFTYVDAVAMPVLRNARNLATAQVL